jgi:signal transduction histidine kinase
VGYKHYACMHVCRVRIYVNAISSSKGKEYAWIVSQFYSRPEIASKYTELTSIKSVINKKDCMIVELRDDTKDSSYYAAGLATYSNSKSIISSYASIFESLWKQNEVYEQLKIHDKMQQEFINVAAHELRTPIQPILGLAAMVPLSQNGVLN